MSAVIQAINQYYGEKGYPILDWVGTSRIQTALDEVAHGFMPVITTTRVKELIQAVDEGLAGLVNHLDKREKDANWTTAELEPVLTLFSAVERDLASRGLVGALELPKSLDEGELPINALVPEDDTSDLMIRLRTAMYQDVRELTTRMYSDLDEIMRTNDTKKLLAFFAKYNIPVRREPEGGGAHV